MEQERHRSALRRTWEGVLAVDCSGERLVRERGAVDPPAMGSRQVICGAGTTGDVHRVAAAGRSVALKQRALTERKRPTGHTDAAPAPTSRVGMEVALREACPAASQVHSTTVSSGVVPNEAAQKHVENAARHGDGATVHRSCATWEGAVAHAKIAACYGEAAVNDQPLHHHCGRSSSNADR